MRLKKDPKTVRLFIVAMNIPLMMGACPLVGYFLGVGVEHIWKISPYGGRIGLFFGVLAAIREVTRSLKKLSHLTDG